MVKLTQLHVASKAVAARVRFLTFPVNMSSITLKDKIGGDVVIHKDYILYRNRSIDSSKIQEIRVKGFRLTFNHFKQNTMLPSMLVMFPNREAAMEAHRAILNLWYPA